MKLTFLASARNFRASVKLFFFFQLSLVDPHLVEAVGLVEREQDEGHDQEDDEHAKEDWPTANYHARKAFGKAFLTVQQ